MQYCNLIIKYSLKINFFCQQIIPKLKDFVEETITNITRVWKMVSCIFHALGHITSFYKAFARKPALCRSQLNIDTDTDQTPRQTWKYRRMMSNYLHKDYKVKWEVTFLKTHFQQLSKARIKLKE